MQLSPVPPIQLRFGPFEVDLSAADLRKRGRKVPLQDQPFKVLACYCSARENWSHEKKWRGRSGRAKHRPFQQLR